MKDTDRFKASNDLIQKIIDRDIKISVKDFHDKVIENDRKEEKD